MDTVLYSNVFLHILNILFFVNFLIEKIKFFSLKQGLARIKAFFEVRMTVESTVYFSPNFNSCSERLGEGRNLRKNYSCDSTVAIYHELCIYAIN